MEKPTNFIEALNYRRSVRIYDASKPIDSAIVNSPLILWEELKAARVAYDIKTERRVWTKNLGLTGMTLDSKLTISRGMPRSSKMR